MEPDRPPLNSVRAFRRRLLMSSHRNTFIHTHTRVNACTTRMHPQLHVGTKYTDMDAKHTHGHMDKADSASGITAAVCHLLPSFCQVSPVTHTNVHTKVHTFASFLPS